MNIFWSWIIALSILGRGITYQIWYISSSIHMRCTTILSEGSNSLKMDLVCEIGLETTLVTLWPSWPWRSSPRWHLPRVTPQPKLTVVNNQNACHWVLEQWRSFPHQDDNRHIFLRHKVQPFIRATTVTMHQMCFVLQKMQNCTYQIYLGRLRAHNPRLGAITRKSACSPQPSRYGG